MTMMLRSVLEQQRYVSGGSGFRVRCRPAPAPSCDALVGPHVRITGALDHGFGQRGRRLVAACRSQPDSGEVSQFRTYCLSSGRLGAAGHPLVGRARTGTSPASAPRRPAPARRRAPEPSSILVSATMMPRRSQSSAPRRYTSSVMRSSSAATPAPTRSVTADTGMFWSCSPRGALEAGVKTGRGSREPSVRPGGSSIPQTAPVRGVVGQGRAGQVAAGHALHRDHVQPPARHRAPREPGRDRRVHQVVRRDVGQLREPPQRQLGQDLPLVRDLRLQHVSRRRRSGPWPRAAARRRRSRRAPAPSPSRRASGPRPALDHGGSRQPLQPLEHAAEPRHVAFRAAGLVQPGLVQRLARARPRACGASPGTAHRSGACPWPPPGPARKRPPGTSRPRPARAAPPSCRSGRASRPGSPASGPRRPEGP